MEKKQAMNLADKRVPIAGGTGELTTQGHGPFARKAQGLLSLTVVRTR
jgi:hypothetical protein